MRPNSHRAFYRLCPSDDLDSRIYNYAVSILFYSFPNKFSPMKLRRLFIAALLSLVAFNAQADYSSGLRAYSEGDFDNALIEWRMLAAKGNPDAQYGLGTLYRNGQGVPIDNQAAASWYRLAADQGQASAMYNLGWMYANGKGVVRNYDEAIRLFQLAAEKGIEGAEHNLAAVKHAQMVERSNAHASTQKSSAALQEQGALAKKIHVPVTTEANASSARMSPSKCSVGSGLAWCMAEFAGFASSFDPQGRVIESPTKEASINTEDVAISTLIFISDLVMGRPPIRLALSGTSAGISAIPKGNRTRISPAGASRVCAALPKLPGDNKALVATRFTEMVRTTFLKSLPPDLVVTDSIKMPGGVIASILQGSSCKLKKCGMLLPGADTEVIEASGPEWISAIDSNAIAGEPVWKVCGPGNIIGVALDTGPEVAGSLSADKLYTDISAALPPGVWLYGVPTKKNDIPRPTFYKSGQKIFFGI